jgi:hypothetical protein
MQLTDPYAVTQHRKCHLFLPVHAMVLDNVNTTRLCKGGQRAPAAVRKRENQSFRIAGGWSTVDKPTQKNDLSRNPNKGRARPKQCSQANGGDGINDTVRSYSRSFLGQPQNTRSATVPVPG